MPSVFLNTIFLLWVIITAEVRVQTPSLDQLTLALMTLKWFMEGEECRNPNPYQQPLFCFVLSPPPPPWAKPIKPLAVLSQERTQFWDVSLPWPPLPGNTIIAVLSVSPKPLSLRLNRCRYTEGQGRHLLGGHRWEGWQRKWAFQVDYKSHKMMHKNRGLHVAPALYKTPSPIASCPVNYPGPCVWTE